MKKVFLSVALVAAMGLVVSSCDDGKAKCWEIGHKVPFIGYVAVDAFYGTAEEADAYIKKEWEGVYSKKKTNKSEEDCRGWVFEIE